MNTLDRLKITNERFEKVYYLSDVLLEKFNRKEVVKDKICAMNDSNLEPHVFDIIDLFNNINDALNENLDHICKNIEDVINKIE